MNGKRVRWNRFVQADSGTALIVPVDHGLTMGPIDGLGSLSEIRRWANHPAITGIIAHRGMADRLADAGLAPRTGGLMIHLNGMTSLSPQADTKVLLTSVEAAIRHGADAVSLQVNFDGSNDAHNLRMLGRVVNEAGHYGLPVLTMVYDKVKSPDTAGRHQRLRHLMRVAVELGTDALKIAAPANLHDLGEIVDGFIDHTAILVAGGSLATEQDVMRLADEVVLQRLTGLCVGRNVFQHREPWTMLTRLGGRLHAPPNRFPRAAHHGPNAERATAQAV